MYYHPIIGIIIFVSAVIFAFILGRLYIKKKLNLISNKQNAKNSNIPKGEVTSPDAPWLDKN
tara:strand:- start:654 stop:839 length:186 start_codon:yes stop_codon:yes gene_type:complete